MVDELKRFFSFLWFFSYICRLSLNIVQEFRFITLKHYPRKLTPAECLERYKTELLSRVRFQSTVPFWHLSFISMITTSSFLPQFLVIKISSHWKFIAVLIIAAMAKKSGKRWELGWIIDRNAAVSKVSQSVV